MSNNGCKSVVCDYCGNDASLVTGRTIYPHRSDLSHLYFWRCAPCRAYVGCHLVGDGKKPLGRLANAELRLAKNKAHAAFDPIWRDGSMKRREAYKWLAARLDIDPKSCHIGMMDVDMCLRVIEVCYQHRE